MHGASRNYSYVWDVSVVDVDLHTKANNFAPNEYRGVVNSSDLVVYKGSKTRVESNGDCNRKVKAESKVKV